MSTSARRDRTQFRRRCRVIALAATFVIAVACHNGPEPQMDAEDEAAAQAPTTLQVLNQQFTNMTIYVLRSGQRFRLGLATGNATTAFVIPRTLVRQQLIQLRFLADPIGGSGAPISDEITVSPGDSVQLTIPPG